MKKKLEIQIGHLEFNLEGRYYTIIIREILVQNFYRKYFKPLKSLSACNIKCRQI